MIILWAIVGVLVFMLAWMGAGWAFQRARNNGGWTDVFWTYGTGLCGVACALLPVAGAAGITTRQGLVAALIAVWSLRLGTYVAIRVSKSAEDVRYSRLREEWGEKFQRNMVGLLLIQSPATALLCLSILIAAQNPAPGLGVRDVVGVAILALSIFGEGLADEQMKAFKASRPRHGEVCERGLWAWSRHPNYFFEWLGWLAYPVIAIQPSHPWTWLSLVGPAFMFCVVRLMTGVPPLEKAMLESKGEAYRDYQRRVSAFLPRPPKSAPGAPA